MLEALDLKDDSKSSTSPGTKYADKVDDSLPTGSSVQGNMPRHVSVNGAVVEQSQSHRQVLLGLTEGGVDVPLERRSCPVGVH